MSSPGVGAYYGAKYTNAAYELMMSGLAPGVYTVRVYAHSTVTGQWTIYPVTVTVTTTPINTVESPTANQAVSQPFNLSGWAMDGSNPTGTGVDAVHVHAYYNYGSGQPPVFLGTATYGDTRTDIGSWLGARFTPSGYHFTLTGQPPGWYWFLVAAHTVRDNGWTFTSQTAFVDIPTSQLTITRGGTGTGAITATGLSCPGGATTQAVPCAATYATGTAVTLTAVPDPGSMFAGWVGICHGSPSTTCGVGLNGDRHLTAMFTQVPGSYETRYYHADVVGSIRAITDETGATVIRHDYAPFGEDTAALTGDPMRFAGKELDPETGMHYFAARYYRNTWGRFTTVDPATGAAVDPQSFNKYAYARNNPLKYVDPTGLSAQLRMEEVVTVMGDDWRGNLTDWDLMYFIENWDSYYGQTCSSHIVCRRFQVDGLDWESYNSYKNASLYGGSFSATTNQTTESTETTATTTKTTDPPPSEPPSSDHVQSKNCTAQRIYSGIVGTANVALAVGKAPVIASTTVAVGAVSGPGAFVWLAYGTVTMAGQGIAGATQLYSAVTGNYGDAAVRVEQVGNIMSGPVMGIGTLVAGGSHADAEKNAANESAFNAGAGLVQAIADGVRLAPAIADFVANVGLFGDSGACR